MPAPRAKLWGWWPRSAWLKVAFVAAVAVGPIIVLGHNAEGSAAIGTPAALETPGTSASSSPQTVPHTSTPQTSPAPRTAPTSAATVPQTDPKSRVTTPSPPATVPHQVHPHTVTPQPVTPQPVYIPPVVTQPYVPVATTAATTTTSTTIAPIRNRLPPPAVTLPLITRGSNGHVNPLFAILSGVGFFLALVIMATTYVLTRSKRGRAAHR